MESAITPPPHNQAPTTSAWPDENLEASSYSKSDNTASTTSSIFNGDVGADPGPLSEDEKVAVPAIYDQFRHLSGPPVTATIPPNALLNEARVRVLFNIIASILESAPLPVARTEQQPLTSPPSPQVIAIIPLSALLPAAQAEQPVLPPTSPLPVYSTPTDHGDFLRPQTPTIVTAPPSARRLNTNGRTSSGSTMENRGAFLSLTEQNENLRNLQDIVWQPLGQARAGNAARPLREQWRVQGGENRFENGFFVSDDSTGEALEPVVLAVVGGEPLQVREE